MPRQRPTATQMIDFRIADLRANSRFASRRFPVIYGSTTRPPGVKFSNDFLARVRVRVCIESRSGGARKNWIPNCNSPADPAARWTGAHGGQAFFAYSTNYLIDVDNAIIVDVEATTAIRQAEVLAAKRSTGPARPTLYTPTSTGPTRRTLYTHHRTHAHAREKIIREFDAWMDK